MSSILTGSTIPTLRRLHPMPSSVIRSFAYQPDTSELLIEFTTGRRYLYSGVPEEEVTRMRSAFAKGIYFNRRIRDRYPFREVLEQSGH